MCSVQIVELELDNIQYIMHRIKEYKCYINGDGKILSPFALGNYYIFIKKGNLIDKRGIRKIKCLQYNCEGVNS